VEEHLDERGGVHPDLVGEGAQVGAPGQPDDLAVPARDLDAADRGRLHVVELLAPLLARLAAARGTPPGRPGRALGDTAVEAAAATPRAGRGAGAGAARRARARTGATAGPAGPGPGTGATGATAAGAAGPTTAGGRARRHAARARPGAARPGTAWPLHISRA